MINFSGKYIITLENFFNFKFTNLNNIMIKFLFAIGISQLSERLMKVIWSQHSSNPIS